MSLENDGPHNARGAWPEARTTDWAEPGADAPILDAARVPLRAFHANKPAGEALALYLWLHLLRPLLLVAFWIGVAFYVWRHFFSQTQDLADMELLGIYAVLILGIFLLMLALAPLRRRIQASEESRGSPPDTSMDQIADYAALPTAQLSLWRRARRLQVRHDEDGRVSAAADLDTQPALLQSARGRRPRASRRRDGS